MRDRSGQMPPGVGVDRAARVRAPAHRCGAARIPRGGIHHSEDRVRLAARPLGRPGRVLDLVEAASRGFVSTSGEERFAVAHQDVRAERLLHRGVLDVPHEFGALASVARSCSVWASNEIVRPVGAHEAVARPESIRTRRSLGIPPSMPAPSSDGPAAASLRRSRPAASPVLPTRVRTSGCRDTAGREPVRIKWSPHRLARSCPTRSQSPPRTACRSASSR